MGPPGVESRLSGGPQVTYLRGHPCPRSDDSGAASLSAAGDERHRCGDAAPDYEASDRRADQSGLAVPDQVPAPVRELGHLRAQIVHGEGELAARLLDLRADHL